MRPVHDVDDGAVLDVRAAADANPVHVAADDRVHPDAALLADLHVADDLRAVVDVGGGMDARETPADRAETFAELYGARIEARAVELRRDQSQVGQATLVPPSYLPPRPAAAALVRRPPPGRRASSARVRPCSVSRWSRIARICASASPPSCG